MNENIINKKKRRKKRGKTIRGKPGIEKDKGHENKEKKEEKEE